MQGIAACLYSRQWRQCLPAPVPAATWWAALRRRLSAIAICVFVLCAFSQWTNVESISLSGAVCQGNRNRTASNEAEACLHAKSPVNILTRNCIITAQSAGKTRKLQDVPAETENNLCFLVLQDFSSLLRSIDFANAPYRIIQLFGEDRGRLRTANNSGGLFF